MNSTPRPASRSFAGSARRRAVAAVVGAATAITAALISTAAPVTAAVTARRR